MPVIAVFYGIMISIRWNEHNPPHFHAEYQDSKALYDFEGNIIDGHMPPQQHKLISAWCSLHKEELQENWKAAMNQEALTSIRGLK